MNLSDLRVSVCNFTEWLKGHVWQISFQEISQNKNTETMQLYKLRKKKVINSASHVFNKDLDEF